MAAISRNMDRKGAAGLTAPWPPNNSHALRKYFTASPVSFSSIPAAAPLRSMFLQIAATIA